MEELENSPGKGDRNGEWKYPPYTPDRLNTLGVVLKLTERCNINCSYCNVFNGMDDSWRSHPKHLSLEVCQRVASFLSDGLRQLPNIKVCRLVLFGGEPLLLGKRAFDMAVGCLKQALVGVDLQIVLTTNAILIDTGWIDIFEKYGIAVAVSLDGPRDVNDRQRIDHQGNGTYDRVAKGLAVLQEAARQGRVCQPSLSAVIQPSSNARQVYRHYVDTLGVKLVNFLLPKSSHDHFDRAESQAYGLWLSDLFDEWTQDDSVDVDIRTLRGYLAAFIKQKAFHDIGDNERREWEHVITIATDGSLGPDDEYRALPLWNQFPTRSVTDTTLYEFLDSHAFHILNRAKREVASECSGCEWRAVCGGGTLTNRYSHANGFANRSVLCDGYKTFFENVLTYLTRHGLQLKQFKEGSPRNLV